MGKVKNGGTMNNWRKLPFSSHECLIFSSSDAQNHTIVTECPFIPLNPTSLGCNSWGISWTCISLLQYFLFAQEKLKCTWCQNVLKYIKPRFISQKSKRSATILHNTVSQGVKDHKVHGQCPVCRLILLGFVIILVIASPRNATWHYQLCTVLKYCTNKLHWD